VSRDAKHRSQRTVAQSSAIFNQLVSSTGGSPNLVYQRRLETLKLDGVCIGEHRPELRNPDSIYYSQSFVEGAAVARALVGMSLDSSVANIHRADRPDVRVEFTDRGPIFFEHRTVTPHDGMVFSRHLEEINRELRRALKANVEALAISERGLLHVSMTDPGVAHRARAATLAKELCTLITMIRTDVDALRAPPAVQPALALYKSEVYYRDGQTSTHSICRGAATWIDQEPAWVRERLRAAVLEKVVTASEYPQSARPLWLLLVLDAADISDLAQSELHEILDGVLLTPFERVIVWTADKVPLLFPS